jgi:hypothetical protein
VTTYGTYGLGADLAPIAWPRLSQIFTGGEAKVNRFFKRPSCHLLKDIQRGADNFLSVHPVQLLMLGNMTKDIHDLWMKQISRCPKSPKIILEFWEPWYIKRNTDGPMAKLTVTRWNALGYDSSCISANATQVGGVVDRKWVICARTLQRAKTGWTWPELPQEVTRPMANCLRYVGVPGLAYRHVPQDSCHPLPNAQTDCMPAMPGAIIKTERGSRMLLHDELCNGLGVPKPWVLEYPDGRVVQTTVALRLLEYLAPVLLSPAAPSQTPVPKTPSRKSKVVTSCATVDDFIVFSWKPPDLSPNSAWTRETIQEL